MVEGEGFGDGGDGERWLKGGERGVKTREAGNLVIIYKRGKIKESGSGGLGDGSGDEIPPVNPSQLTSCYTPVATPPLFFHLDTILSSSKFGLFFHWLLAATEPLDLSSHDQQKQMELSLLGMNHGAKFECRRECMMCAKIGRFESFTC